MANDHTIHVSAEALKAFCRQMLEKLGVSEEDAKITADVLMASDLRGIESHGVARLRRFYVNRLREGAIPPRPLVRTVHETPVTAVIDGGGGLGHPTSYRAMKLAIDKACKVGTGFVTVRNSNHFGIAGYYAMMALEHGCIGLAMTNGNRWVVPTFGRDSMLGTNPIAVAMPAGRERPFVLDMATSTAAVGKVEIAERLGKPIPLPSLARFCAMCGPP
jgi:LDH2 family malate/lactate/ureidoglycolate dehydrogenase